VELDKHAAISSPNGILFAKDTHSASAVFVMTNNVDRNEVVAYRRVNDGALQESGRFASGGRRSGGNNDPLESQGSLTLGPDHSLLFAVNAGSGSDLYFTMSEDAA
jgi:hypothetical protein